MQDEKTYSASEIAHAQNMMKARMMRIVNRMKCKNAECKNQRRNGSAYCQECSDKRSK